MTPEPAESAGSFLRRHAESLFARPVSVDRPSSLEWRGSRSRSHRGIHQLWYDQYHEGIRVEGAWLRLEISAHGQVLGLDSHYRPVPEDIELRPGIDAPEAERIARRALNAGDTDRAPSTAELLLDPSAGRLVWRLSLPLWSPFGDWELELDARSGEPLTIRNRMVHGEELGRAPRLSPAPLSSTVEDLKLARAVTGSAWVLPANPLNGHPERYAMRDGDPVDGFREWKTLERLDGTGRLRGSWVDAWLDPDTEVIEAGLVYDFSADLEGSAFHAANAYWHIDSFQDYLQNTLGIVDANARQTRVIVHDHSGDDSYYSPVTDIIRFGDGGVDDAEDGEVVLHEYGHAIHENIVPDYLNEGESGAVSEGLGDYLAASFGGNALFGEWDATSSNPGPPPFLRRVDTDKHYPEDRVGQIHADGEIVSGVWWRLWNELGKETADRLVFESLFLLGPQSGFTEFADAMMQVDEELFAGTHLAAIHTAYRERGIPVSYPLVIYTTPLAHTTDLEGPYPVEIELSHAEALAATDPVQLYWRRAGDPDWTVIPMSEGVPDSWIAEIPGDGTPGEIQYALRARDARGVEVWSPYAGPDRYYEFQVLADQQPPTLVHDALEDTPLTVWPPTVNVWAQDPSGILMVRVDWYRNDLAMGGFALPPQGDNLYAAPFPLPAIAMQEGDRIDYIVTGQDSLSNAAQSGPHSFTVLGSRGPILVLVDPGDPQAASGKYGRDKQLLPAPSSRKGASSQALVEDLSKAGFEVSVEDPAVSDPQAWNGYELLVLSAGASTTPAADADFRSALSSWIAQGGKLLVEGGEIGYDAASNPGYPQFASTVLHVDRWEADDSGDLVAAPESEFHPLRNTPHALPETLPLRSGLEFGEQDTMVPAADAQLLYGSTEFPQNAGILAFDDNSHPSSAQIVYWAFAYTALADSSLAARLADNTASYLTAEEPAPSAKLSGEVKLEDGTPAEGLELKLLPTGLSALSGTDGSFQFYPLYAGSYLLEVAGPPGYETARIPLALDEGEVISGLEIQLRVTTLFEVCDQLAEPIPDADPEGVVRMLDPGADGEVVGIRVQIEISHPWRGDLFVELESPSGTVVVLHNRSGSDLDDLDLVYPDSTGADGPGQLEDFLGEKAKGAWVLHVADLGAGDTGSFVGACLELTTAKPIDVPVLVSDLRAWVEGDEVVLQWYGGAAGEGWFRVSRSVDGSVFQVRGRPERSETRGLSFRDPVGQLPPGTRLRYRLDWQAEGGTLLEDLAGIELAYEGARQRVLTLEQNHPNPFNPRTRIVFRLPREAIAQLRVYDLQGRRVRTLHDGLLTAGEHGVDWDGTDDTGREVAAGTYYYELRSEGRRLARPMVLLK